MIAALRYEWVRLRTIRSTWILALVTLLLSGGIALLVATQAGEAGDDAQVGALLYRFTVLAAQAFGPVLLGVVGVLAFGHDYRYGTIRSTLLGVQSRPAVFGAKALVPAVFAAVVVAATTVVCGAIAVTLFSGSYAGGLTGSGLPGKFGGLVLYVVGWTLIGVALGAILRNVVPAVVVLVGVPFVLEGIVVQILDLLSIPQWLKDAFQYLPSAAGGRMFDAFFGGGTLTADPPSPLVGGLAFYGWVVVLLLIGAVVFQRRDA